jgi:hypothetical protein
MPTSKYIHLTIGRQRERDKVTIDRNKLILVRLEKDRSNRHDPWCVQTEKSRVRQISLDENHTIQSTLEYYQHHSSCRLEQSSMDVISRYR